MMSGYHLFIGNISGSTVVPDASRWTNLSAVELVVICATVSLTVLAIIRGVLGARADIRKELKEIKELNSVREQPSSPTAKSGETLPFHMVPGVAEPASSPQAPQILMVSELTLKEAGELADSCIRRIHGDQSNDDVRWLAQQEQRLIPRTGDEFWSCVGMFMMAAIAWGVLLSMYGVAFVDGRFIECTEYQDARKEDPNAKVYEASGALPVPEAANRQNDPESSLDGAAQSQVWITPKNGSIFLSDVAVFLGFFGWNLLLFILYALETKKVKAAITRLSQERGRGYWMLYNWSALVARRGKNRI